MPILTNGPSTVKGPRLTETIIFQKLCETTVWYFIIFKNLSKNIFLKSHLLRHLATKQAVVWKDIKQDLEKIFQMFELIVR